MSDHRALPPDLELWGGIEATAGRGLPTAIASVSLEQRAVRPRFSALASERGWIMPALANAVERFLEQRERVLERTAAGQPLERGGM